MGFGFKEQGVGGPAFAFWDSAGKGGLRSSDSCLLRGTVRG